MFDDGTFSGQFIGAGVYGYEKDVFQHMRDIEGVAQALSTANYGTFKVLDNNERSYSLYGKALEKEIKNLDLIQKDIDADIRSIQSRIKDFRNSGMRNGKLEVDLTVAKQSYFKMQVDIIKAKVDIFSKARYGFWSRVLSTPKTKLVRAKAVKLISKFCLNINVIESIVQV